jgi:phosphonoacetate hydrolase
MPSRRYVSRIHSALLSEHVLKRGVELMRAVRPDLMYLSTNDYVQHTHAPGSPEANQFCAIIDRQLMALDRSGAALVVTADHGMRAKADARGRPRVVFLETLLNEWFGSGTARVILPITDPYVAHHGSLGSFATIYLAGINAPDVVRRLVAVPAIQLALERSEACRRFELPSDRIGDVVVCADGETVLGTKPEDHDLSQLLAPLRSHGGLAEREVPLLFNRPISKMAELTQLRNYDAFWIGLNGIGRKEL